MRVSFVARRLALPLFGGVIFLWNTPASAQHTGHHPSGGGGSVFGGGGGGNPFGGGQQHSGGGNPFGGGAQHSGGGNPFGGGQQHSGGNVFGGGGGMNFQQPRFQQPQFQQHQSFQQPQFQQHQSFQQPQFQQHQNFQQPQPQQHQTFQQPQFQQHQTFQQPQLQQQQGLQQTQFQQHQTLPHPANTAAFQQLPHNNAIPTNTVNRQILPNGGSVVAHQPGLTGNALPARTNAIPTPARNNTAALSNGAGLVRNGNARPAQHNPNALSTTANNGLINHNPVQNGLANVHNKLPGRTDSNAVPLRTNGNLLPGRGNSLAGNNAAVKPARGPQPINTLTNHRISGGTSAKGNSGLMSNKTLANGTGTGLNSQHQVYRPTHSNITPNTPGRDGQNLAGTGRTGRHPGTNGTGLGVKNSGVNNLSSTNGQNKLGQGTGRRVQGDTSKFNRPVLGSAAANASRQNINRPGVRATTPSGALAALGGAPQTNRLRVNATNPGSSLALLGDQSGVNSANVLMGTTLGGIKTPSNLNAQGRQDLDTFRQDVQNGASADQIQADLAKVKDDIQQQGLNGNLVVGADALEQKADQVASLAAIRDQLQQGQLADDQPLPTGLATFINNPFLPAGQMVVMGDDTVVVGGAGLPIPDGATYVPTGDGGNVAVWTGTMADLGIPVQQGAPIADVDPVALGTPPPDPTPTGTVVVVNPADSGGPVQYSIAGETFSLEPGFQQEHAVDQSAVVEFDRGEQFGQARYTLTPESYQFLVTDHGWDLHKVPHAITLDNSENPSDFNYIASGQNDVVPAGQTKTINGQAVLRLAFDRGDGGEPAVKDLGDGAYKIGVDAQSGLLDLFAENSTTGSIDGQGPGPVGDAPPPPAPGE